MPVSRTGSPATVASSSVAGRGLRRLGGLAELGARCRAHQRRANIIRPSSETNARSPVEAKEAILRSGQRLTQALVGSGQLGPHSRRVDPLPGGRVTTGTSGAV